MGTVVGHAIAKFPGKRYRMVWHVQPATDGPPGRPETANTGR